MAFALNDLVRVVGSSRFAGMEGRVSEVDYASSVPLVVNLPGQVMGICFTDDAVELVEAASPLASVTGTLKVYEVYSEAGQFRWATTDRHQLGRRAVTDYVLTRDWAPQGSPEVHARKID